ncbi:ras and Rab interactor 1-like [Megalops cyprinoides]|uniref:ras and Rab interactor 1-like n=1 Tax=Megalops cyprinoides TaxID=118141 RepID=UPI0018655CA4|nr:ras and Rab interactor 1-like [Megalops cyprinoides]
MQEDPVYDFPEPQAPIERASPQRGSLKSISVLDRLLLTHPVWLQLSINSATALHILQREPPGTFLVRKSNTSQKKVLCVRLADDSVPSFVKQFIIREQDSTFSLESSAISFPDLCRLIAFYCVSRDVLPFTLELPQAIARATSHKQLESISHMGVEFWSSQLNFRGPRNGPPVVEGPPPSSPSPEECATPQENPSLFQEFCPIRTRSPRELDCGAGQGALCFINPLFLQEAPCRGALLKRHQFKRSLKVRVSTETSSPLSPPAAPPPPPPLLAKGARQKPATAGEVRAEPRGGTGGGVVAEEAESDYRQPGLVLQKKKCTPALSPTEEEDYQMPKTLLQGREEPSLREDALEAGLVLEQRHAPSLSELDSSSSLSSLEELEESPERPPLTRGTSSPAPPTPSRQPATALRKMSAAFASFFSPEKRVARLVEELSRDRRSAFGALVQDFLRQQREGLKARSSASAIALLQGLRHFLSQAKRFLLDCSELEPPIETLVPENETDQALEKAVFRCVLKPLKSQVDAALRSLHAQDGSSQQLTDGLHAAQEGALERFGVRVGVPDAQGVEKVRRKLQFMQRAYSPIDKVLLLLQACKCIYSAMTTAPGQEFGADEFLPALSYVIVQCNMPELLLEVEYMMELLEPAWLTGEGGYYLTSVYASLCLIQSQPEAPPPSGLTNQARESLKEWSRRRSKEAKSQKDAQQHQRFVRVLFQEGECSSVKTLLWKEGDSGEALAQLCASKFGVSEPEQYALYWRGGGEAQPVPPEAQMQDLQIQGGGGPSFTYQRCDQDSGKMRKLTRGGAVDLGESH